MLYNRTTPYNSITTIAFFVILLGTPGKPQDLEFETHSDRHSVKWNPPMDCGASELKKYQIVIVKKDRSFDELQDERENIAANIQSAIAANGNYVQAFVPWNKTKYSITTSNLSSTTGLIASVCAYNDEGCGKSSYFISG